MEEFEKGWLQCAHCVGPSKPASAGSKYQWPSSKPSCETTRGPLMQGHRSIARQAIVSGSILHSGACPKARWQRPGHRAVTPDIRSVSFSGSLQHGLGSKQPFASGCQEPLLRFPLCPCCTCQQMPHTWIVHCFARQPANQAALFLQQLYAVARPRVEWPLKISLAQSVCLLSSITRDRPRVRPERATRRLTVPVVCKSGGKRAGSWFPLICGYV